MLQLVLFIILIVSTYFIGSAIEKSHYKSIGHRELKTILIPAVTAREVIREDRTIENSALVYGSAVISIDYFKRISAALKNFFGGEISAYETVLDRARKEAVLRMKEKVPTADIIINTRIETSTIGRTGRRNAIACAEVLAYGTAITYKGSVEKKIQQDLRLRKNNKTSFND
ncbi:MAG: heavy metal-binding domain-containing protein [Candidatus Omnitrophica bacterium]|nr:heavy metal-binding domain-containing protein [Candidatus Omnitrophota bacterium]